jgi:TPR repeat protein
MKRPLSVSAGPVGGLFALLLLTGQALSADTSGCAPVVGKGALSLPICEAAAKSGDGRAAIIVGQIYWNGDGIPKDNATAATWWKMADQDGRADAAMLLGNEAYVRAVQGHSKQFDDVALKEASSWFQKTVATDPQPENRKKAQGYLEQINKYYLLKSR